MREKTNKELRGKLDEAVREVANLEGMALNFVNRGKAEINGPYLTRPQFADKIDNQTQHIRLILKEVITALRLEQ
jgi:hypothetical protein